MAHIKTYARIKPSKRAYDDYEATNTTLYMRVPDILRDANGQVRTRMCTVNHEFKFTHVFNDQVPQEQVFEVVASDIIDGFLNGYNGTIFAYGQTGSGKTFTVEGSARRYEDRGLAPRALSMIYKQLEAREDVQATVHVSYMEIYQEVGYDLLNQAARSSSAVTPFPKVAVVEGTKGSCVVRNLSSHLAANEDVAQSLLLQGQANRKVAETPMNQRSSRSHAVFTITLTCKKQNDEIITKSKLHLVDLAGSERVSKTGIHGQQLAEAKYINLSLHYLEGVIIALHQEEHGYRPNTAASNNYSSFYKKSGGAAVSKRPATQTGRKTYNSSGGSYGGRPSSADGYGRTYSAAKHVPYRNSLLTMLLKDSLGGNCQTAMIATVSVEEENLSESLSTCRFAQRVACITNTVRKNEEIDDKLMIKRLRKRIAELETELALLKSGQGGDTDPSMMDAKLTEDDRRDCARIVQSYIGGQVNDPIIAGITTPLRFRECMRLFKAMVKSRQTDTTRPYPNNRPLNAWTEVQEPRPSTVPNNMKMSMSGLGSSSDIGANTSHNTSVTSSQLQTTLNTSSNSQVQSEPAASHQNTSKRRSLSASSAPVSSGNKIANDIDLRMSQMSLVPRDTIGSRGSSSRSHNRMYNLDSRTSSRSSSRNSYKSPFERKREKTIKLLADQVRRKRNEQQEEQEALKDFQSSIKEQQLTMVHAELSAKCEDNKRQLDEQHARVKQIKAEGINEQLYTQEKVIERQLRKRQAKMEKRLALVEAHMELLAQHAAAEEKEKTEKKPDIPPDPTKAKGYGTVLNSRMVLDKLQEEDKKQEKLQSKIERDRVIALSQQIELKEAATRQKLKDLKQKLKEGKSITAEDLNKGRMLKPAESDMVVADLEEEPVKDVNQNDKKPNETFTLSFKLKPTDSKSTNSPFAQQPNFAQLGLSTSPRATRTADNQYQNMFKRKENKKNSDDLWSKSYSASRQSSMIMDTTKPDMFASSSKTDPFSSNAKTDPFSSNSKTDPFSSSSKPDPFMSGLPSKKLLFGDLSSSALNSSPVKAAGYEDLPAGLLQNNMPNGDTSTEHDDDLELNDLQMDTDHFPSKDAHNVISPRDVMRSLEEAAKLSLQKHSVANKTTDIRAQASLNTSSASKGHGDQNTSFGSAANKKTFESALQNMLAMDETDRPGPLTIQQNDYDEFARSNRKESSSHARTIYTQKVKSQSRVYQDKMRRKETTGASRSRQLPLSPRQQARPSSSDAWGPEAKTMSMSDRLAKFLDTDILPVRPGHGNSYDDNDMAPYRKPKILHETEPSNSKVAKAAVVDIDVDDYKPKIKAVPESKRETAYMTTVREQKDRVTRIRKARRAAEVIQRAWQNYSRKKRR